METKTNKRHDELVAEFQAWDERRKANNLAYKRGERADYKTAVKLQQERWELEDTRKQIVGELRDYYPGSGTLYRYSDYLEAVKAGKWVRG